MIIGIGSDIVEHNLTKQLKWDSDKEFLHRVFSLEELEFCTAQNCIRFLSGRFAAKEAVLKCLGTGMQDGISLTDIQVLQSQKGKPIIFLNGEVKKISESIGISLWHVSITHTIKYSLAFVIAEGK